MPLEPRDVARVGEVGPIGVEAHRGFHAGGPGRARVHVEEHPCRRIPHLLDDGAPRPAPRFAPATDVSRAHALGEALEQPQQPVGIHGDVHALQPNTALPADAVRFGIDRLVAGHVFLPGLELVDHVDHAGVIGVARPQQPRGVANQAGIYLGLEGGVGMHGFERVQRAAPVGMIEVGPALVVDVHAPGEGAVGVLVREERAQHAPSPRRIGEPAKLAHVALGAVGDRHVERADPLAHGGIAVVADPARDRIEAQAVPAVAPMTVQVRVGAAERRHSAKELLPAALGLRTGPVRSLARGVVGGCCLRASDFELERQRRQAAHRAARPEPQPPLQPQVHHAARVDPLEVQLIPQPAARLPAVVKRRQLEPRR